MVNQVYKTDKYINKGHSKLKRNMFSERDKGGAFALIIFILCFVLISSVSSTEVLGVFKQNDNIQLLQTCTVCNYVTLDSIKLPNTTIIFVNENMTKSGSTFYYYFNQTELVGEYIYNTWFGNYTAPVSFEVTYTGKTLTSAKSSTNILIFFVSLLIFAGLLILGLAIPGDNKKDEMTGYILYVSNLKYLKHLLLALSYVVLVFLAYFSWMITYAYLDMPFVSDVLRFVFNFLAVATLPLFILYVYLSIANLVRDSKVKEALSYNMKITE